MLLDLLLLGILLLLLLLLLLLVVLLLLSKLLLLLLLLLVILLLRWHGLAVLRRLRGGHGRRRLLYARRRGLDGRERRGLHGGRGQRLAALRRAGERLGAAFRGGQVVHNVHRPRVGKEPVDVLEQPARLEHGQAHLLLSGG